MTPEERWRLAWPYRCDRAALSRLRGRSASGETETDLAALDALTKRQEADRMRAEGDRIKAERARLGLDAPGSGGDVLTRASRYLATIDGGPGGAIKAAIKLVRGWALDEGDALALMLTEYAPRYHRALPRAEIVGMVRRASRATGTGYGWLLAGRDRPR